MNQDEFDQVMQRLAGTYSQQESTPQQRREMHRVLADYPVGAVDRAVDSHIDQSEYFPKPSQLLALIDKAPGVYTADCGVCAGSGWIETTAPERDDAGHKAQGPEQPWVYKCKVCGGSGRGHG